MSHSTSCDLTSIVLTLTCDSSHRGVHLHTHPLCPTRCAVHKARGFRVSIIDPDAQPRAKTKGVKAGVITKSTAAAVSPMCKGKWGGGDVDDCSGVGTGFAILYCSYRRADGIYGCSRTNECLLRFIFSATIITTVITSLYSPTTQAT